MKLVKDSLRLYAVTDRAWLGDRHLADCVEEAIQAGVTILQLREKDLPFEAFLHQAQELKKVTDRYQVPFIINDSVEVALACNADGVHVGQSDTGAQDVRARIGQGKILGVSVQTVEQAMFAEEQGADYLGVGAVFSTATKSDADLVSLDTLKAICSAVNIPVVAIGGIGKQTIPQLQGSGIDGIAVVSSIFAQHDISAATRELSELVERLIS